MKQLNTSNSGQQPVFYSLVPVAIKFINPYGSFPLNEHMQFRILVQNNVHSLLLNKVLLLKNINNNFGASPKSCDVKNDFNIQRKEIV